MMLIPSAVPDTAPAFRRLIDPERTPWARGGLVVEAIPVGLNSAAEQPPQAESASLLLAGRARCEDRTEELMAGSGWYHPPGSRSNLTATGAAPALVLTVQGLNAHGVAVGHHSDRHAAPVPLVPRAEHSAGRLSRDGGFTGMGVHWLVSKDTLGAHGLTLATSTFTPGGSHELHRHPHADEFFLVLAGGGSQLTETGPVPLREGDLAYVPAGEWHGFSTGDGVTTVALYGYLGAGSLTGAGYQLRGEER